MYTVDLHTHSTASPDGSLRARDYKAMLDSGRLDVIAVTDHDTITFARELQQALGQRIIIGEEISTTEGEIIGLYLTKLVKPGLGMAETIKHIHDQNGLVYIPHPFETVRRGLPRVILDHIANEVDIIEIFNGRAYFQNKSGLAKQWAKAHGVAGAASSDAHGWYGWGKTGTIVGQPPTQANILQLLPDAQYAEGRVGLSGLMYPKLNRLRKGLGRAQ